MSEQKTYSIQYMMENISPVGTAPGAVVASPSRDNPNYFYHWVRDASLVTDVVVGLDELATGQDKVLYDRTLDDLIDFSRQLQLTPNPSGGLGEPKFNADGSPFQGAWGRPQDDGPALRAIALTHLANDWLDDGQVGLVRQKLYDAGATAQTVIKADLDYVASHWTETCFDLWEETRGHHFFTEMVERRALLDGADLADRLGDKTASAWYRQQAGQLEDEINRHWDAGRGIIIATLDRDGGLDYKQSGLDAGTILGVLRGWRGDSFFAPTDSRVQATVNALEKTFGDLYPINHDGLPGVLIGRYPEDRYDGYTSNSQGNPWVLLTNAFAEYYYRVASTYRDAGVIHIDSTNTRFFRALSPKWSKAFRSGQAFRAGSQGFTQIIQQIQQRGDDFLEANRRHGLSAGHFSEEMNRQSGYMQGANDLTWNYASYLTAYWSRR